MQVHVHVHVQLELGGGVNCRNGLICGLSACSATALIIFALTAYTAVCLRVYILKLQSGDSSHPVEIFDYQSCKCTFSKVCTIRQPVGGAKHLK